jgi:NADH:ubiquinone oxidoreductase subunit 6 (subunit J)
VQDGLQSRRNRERGACVGPGVTEWFFRIDAWITGLVLAAVLTVVWAVAGRKQAPGGEPRSGPTKGEEAILALLGLLLAFSFGMGMSKHDTRRAMAVDDANAIGDFYTTTRMVGEPTRTALHATVREYVENRLAAMRSSAPVEADDSTLRRSAALQATMVQLVRESIQDESRAPVAVVLIQTLNGLTSSHVRRLMASRDHLPASIVLLLIAASVLGIVILAKNEAPRNASILAFVALVSALVFVIFDLNQPRRGLIQVSQEPMTRLYESILADEKGP